MFYMRHKFLPVTEEILKRNLIHHRDFSVKRFSEPCLMEPAESEKSTRFYYSKTPFELIKYPVFSDKGFRLIEQSQYIFAVDVRATKPLIKTSLEQLFDVSVDSVNTLLPPAKKRSRGRFKTKKSRYKRAFVKLASGDKIKIFEDSESEEN